MKILIADDHPIVVSGLAALLSEPAGDEVISARDGARARELFVAEKPDVTVVDVNLPDVSGFELTRQLLDLDADAKILIFTMNDDPILAVRALDCGARAFLSKNDDPLLFREAIAAIEAGQIWLPMHISQEVALIRSGAPKRMARLTERELEILRQLSRGKSMSEIASQIDVSYKTVASACTSMRTKLNARTPAEMVRIAVELKMV